MSSMSFPIYVAFKILNCCLHSRHRGNKLFALISYSVSSSAKIFCLLEFWMKLCDQNQNFVKNLPTPFGMHAGKQFFFSIRSHVMSKCLSIVLVSNHIEIQPLWESVSPSYSSTIKLKYSPFANQRLSVICFEMNSFVHYRSNHQESCYMYHLQLKYFLIFNEMINTLKTFSNLKT